MATPRDFQKIVIAHKMKLDFGLALKELDLTLDKDSTMDNFKVFKDGVYLPLPDNWYYAPVGSKRKEKNCRDLPCRRLLNVN